MNKIVLIFLVFSLLLVPNQVFATIQPSRQIDFSKAWWNFDVSNETVDGWTNYTTADGQIFNATFSYARVNAYGDVLTWYYTENGELLGWENNRNLNGTSSFSWKLSKMNYTQVGNETYSFEEKGIFNLTSPLSWGYTNLSYFYVAEVRPDENIVLPSNKTITVYPFIILIDISLRIGTEFYSWPKLGINDTMIWFGNHTWEMTTQYLNGTTLVRRGDMETVYINITGTYSPTAMRVSSLTLRIHNPNTIKPLQLNSILNKKLQDYNLGVEENPSTNTSIPVPSSTNDTGIFSTSTFAGNSGTIGTSTSTTISSKGTPRTTQSTTQESPWLVIGLVVLVPLLKKKGNGELEKIEILCMP